MQRRRDDVSSSSSSVAPDVLYSRDDNTFFSGSPSPSPTHSPTDLADMYGSGSDSDEYATSEYSKKFGKQPMFVDVEADVDDDEGSDTLSPIDTTDATLDVELPLLVNPVTDLSRFPNDTFPPIEEQPSRESYDFPNHIAEGIEHFYYYQEMFERKHYIRLLYLNYQYCNVNDDDEDVDITMNCTYISLKSYECININKVILY